MTDFENGVWLVWTEQYLDYMMTVSSWKRLSDGKVKQEKYLKIDFFVAKIPLLLTLSTAVHCFAAVLELLSASPNKEHTNCVYIILLQAITDNVLVYVLICIGLRMKSVTQCKCSISTQVISE